MKKAKGASVKNQGMGTWKNKSISKTSKASRTPGKAKGANCQSTVLERYMAKRNRSYKHPSYSLWCEIMTGNKPSRSLGGI